MYNVFSAWLDASCRQASIGLEIYTKILESSTQLYTNRILSWDIHEESKNQVQPFPERHTPPYHWEHQTIYYDFPHHHLISQEDWKSEMKNDFYKNIPAISQKILWDSKDIQAFILKYHKEFLRYTYLYISHLMNPLFQEDHYEKFKKKHIWIQWRKDNVIFAFSFPPEEMSLYGQLDSLRLSWNEVKESLVLGLSGTIWPLDDLWVIYEKIRLCYQDEDTKSQSWEEWWKEAKSEIINFMSMLESFDPENYLLFERELLEKTHKWMKESLAQ